MLKFNRLGPIQIEIKLGDKFKSHFALPTPVNLQGQTFLYFSVRDQNNRGHIFRGSWDPNTPLKVANVEQVLSPGDQFQFDVDGCSVGCVMVPKHSNEVWMYYLGWQLQSDVPWRNQVGLAVSKDGGRSFQKFYKNPVVGISTADPYSLSYPFLLPTWEGYEMWYGSNLRWGRHVDQMDHVMKYRVSKNGESWIDKPNVCLPLGPSEVGMARPWVRKVDGAYQLFCGIKSDKYRIHAFESQMPNDFSGRPLEITWQGAQGVWESDEQTYPAIYQAQNKHYLFYCGNRYGETGFGVALIE